MKKILTLLAGLVMAGAALAQTPEEIVNRMDEVLDKQPQDRLAMTMDLKIPIIGTISSRTYSLGDKFRIEGAVKDKTVITWIDGDTEWTYNQEKNEIVIKKRDPEKTNEATEGKDDMKMFEKITEGYDVTLEKETEEAWYFLCKKAKTNKKKDDPKKMNLSVQKGTFMPLSISAKMNGVTITMRDLAFDVTEADVTFDASRYPGVTIKDER